jgi:membrane-bound serine protease (ClpP class)
MNFKILFYFLTLVLFHFPMLGRTETYEVKEISFFEVNSAITPATLDYLEKGFSKTPDRSLIIIKLNTPGGLVTTTKDIITAIGRQNRPVIVWITPEGASAASAGAIIASAAHLILMSPGTSLGAATPVGLGEDLKESDGRRKALNDLRSLVRSLSNERNRPAAPFEEMIERAASFTDGEAIDLEIALSVTSDSLKTLLQGRSLKVLGKELTLSVPPSVSQKTYDQTFAQRILEILANPSLAYLLFLLGIALLYFEFQAPGGYVAGSVGVCLLLIAAIAFQVLPFDWGALGLMFIGFVLLVIEIYVTSYGLLFLTGMVFFILGSLFLFQDHSGFISIHYFSIYSSLAGVFLGMGIVVWYLWRERKLPSRKVDFFLPQNSPGVVLSKKGDSYQIKVRGEIWTAYSEEIIAVDDPVIITAVDPDKLILKIRKSI